ncbi:uncharacterized protein LOC113497501 isoform X1 [Trichoplusia ni]|uniref:Uncharacterized protein LOC113497501 isoform X1 n=1 Tax=Trichoplusia ni TaxID=7111 RepID=A0A7E5VX07_TRINI|nr:uncharacterized protein LOC113497501 isoform X1 [Trichoplusia ni]
MGAKRRDLFLLILLLGILTSRADAAGLMDGPSSIISQATGMAGGLMGKGGPTGMLDQLGGLGGIMGDGGPMKYLSMVKGLAGGGKYILHFHYGPFKYFYCSQNQNFYLLSSHFARPLGTEHKKHIMKLSVLYFIR